MITGIVGIECGSKKCSISKFGRNGLESIISESSNREIPSVIVFGEEQRLFAELAQDRVKAHPQSSVFSPFRLCCANALPEIKDKFTFFVMKENSTDEIIVKKESLRFIQVVGSYFTYLDRLIAKSFPLQSAYACVVSAPNYFSIADKIKLQQAYNVAVLPCLSIIDEHQAVAYSYLQFSNKELHHQNKRVLFIDVGETQMSCFIYNFSHLQANTEYIDCRGEMGVRNIDRGVYTFLQNTYPQVFNSQKGINKKSQLRILEAIEKLRKVLSSNVDANLLVECVTADDDLQHNFSRVEFENIIKMTGFNQKLEEMLNRVVSFCMQQDVNINEIEILGGGTRIPLVQSIIKTILRKQKPLGITFQGSETISKGCAIACQIIVSGLNPMMKRPQQFSVKTMMEQNSVIELYLQGQKCGEQTYNAGHYLPYTATINANVPRKPEEELLLIEIELRYNQMVFKTTEHHLHPDEKVSIRYRIAENGVMSIQTTTIQIPDSVMMDEKNETRNREVQLKLVINGNDIDESIISKMVASERIARQNDEEVVQRQEKRNQLELYVNESLRYAQEKEIIGSRQQSDTAELALRVLLDNKEYIENNYSSISLNEIEERMQMVRDVFEPLKKSGANRQTIDSVVVSSLDELKQVSTTYAAKEIKNLELALANKSIGDAAPTFMKLFKTGGSEQLRDYLGNLNVTHSLTISLGNNSFTDNALEKIFGILSTKTSMNSSLVELRLNLESNQQQLNTNVFTLKGIQLHVIKFIERLDALQRISLTVNHMDQLSLDNMTMILAKKKTLKRVVLVVRNIEQNQYLDRQKFISQLQKTCEHVEFDCYNQKGIKIF